jgi:thiol-disulfide isomerase/thioredoxin
MRAALLALLLAWTCAVRAGPGDAAADFALADAQGGTVRLSELRGSVVYVDFWASWCAPCLKSFPWMNEIQQRYGDQGLRIVAVNLDQKRADADGFLARVPGKFTIVFDAAGATARTYNVRGMPSSVLIDRQGRVQFEHIGFRESSRDVLEAQIKRVIAQP